MRKGKGRSDGFVDSKQGEQGFWSSYADMMSAVALVLFFLMLMSYIQNLITGNHLQSTEEALASTRDELTLTVTQVKDAEEELNRISIDLNSAQEELDKQQSLLDSQKLIIAEQEAYLAASTQELEEQKKTIESQKAMAARQEKYLASTQAEIKELRQQMQTIAVLRLSILEQIKDSIAKVMGDETKVSIGENGSIILSESILFDLGSSELKGNSTQLLNQLSRVFAAFLADNSNAKYVDTILISGHTDNTGGIKANRTLSTDRAHSVLNFLMDANSGQLNKYSQYFCAAGYGAARPVADNTTAEGRAANRRIEISIILRDETVLDIVDQYLSIEMPS